MATALVLSGGASQGSFEVGALDYLYSRGFFAGFISSTSVGSVNALMLAHGGNARDQAAAFTTLKSIWETELTFNEDMYVEAPWLAGVSPRTREQIASLFSGVDIPAVVAQVIFFPPYAIGQAIATGVDLGEALDAFTKATSVFTLEPTRQKIAAHLNAGAVATSGVELRLVAVSLDSGAIRYVTQSGDVIERDGRPVPGPNPTLCRAERNAYNTAMAAKTAAGKAVNQAKPEERQQAIAEYRAADAAAGQAKGALDACLAAQGTTQLRVTLEAGTMASSAIPCIFPPVVMGDEAYVDGGIRWTLPLQTAVDFDPELIVAVNTAPAGVPPPGRHYKDATIPDIAERSIFGLELWETQESHLHAARLESTQRAQKVWVITPRFVVHDGFTVDPGLIDINIAYGHMCAADVTTAFPFTAQLSVAPAAMRGRPGPLRPEPRSPLFVDAPTDHAQGALADGIARCRRLCWEIEHEIFGQSLGGGLFAHRSESVRVPNGDALEQLRTLKMLLGLMVEARRQTGGVLPPGALQWADKWERHRWAPSDVPATFGDSPWGSFSSSAGSWPAETRQTIFVARGKDRAEVYLVNPLRHWFPSPAELAPFGGFAVVKEVPAELLDAIPQGDNVA